MVAATRLTPATPVKTVFGKLAALHAGRASKPVKIVFGPADDSIIEGVGTTSTTTESPLHFNITADVEKSLTALYPTAGVTDPMPFENIRSEYFFNPQTPKPSAVVAQPGTGSATGTHANYGLANSAILQPAGSTRVYSNFTSTSAGVWIQAKAAGEKIRYQFGTGAIQTLTTTGPGAVELKTSTHAVTTGTFTLYFDTGSIHLSTNRYVGTENCGYHVYNGAHSGWSTQEVLQYTGYLDQLAKIQPDAIVWEFATNDARRMNADLFQQKLFTIGDAIRQVCPNAIFVLAPPQESYFTSRAPMIDTSWEKYMIAYSAVANRYTNTVFFPASDYPDLGKDGTPYGVGAVQNVATNPTIMFDALHLKTLGSARITKYIYVPVLTGTIGGGTVTPPDTTAPTAAMTAPAATTVIPASTTVVFSATAADADSGVAQCNFYSLPGNVLIGHGGLVSGTAVSGTWSVSKNSALLDSGMTSVYAQAIDNAGNLVNSTPRNMTVTATSSGGAVASGTTLSVSPTSSAAGATVTLTAFITPTAATGTVQFTDGGIALGAPVTVSSGQAVKTVTTFGVGTHTLQANFTPTSTAAYTVSSSTPQTATVTSTDNAGPAMTVTSLVVGGGTVVDSTHALHAVVSATDPSGVVIVAAHSGTGDDTYVDTLINTPGTNNWVLDKTYDQLQGKTNIRFVAADGSPAYNTSATPSQTMTVATYTPPTTPDPVITSVLPASGSLLVDTVTFSANVTVSSGTIDSVAFYNDNTLIGRGVPSGSVYTYTANVADLPAGMDNFDVLALATGATHGVGVYDTSVTIGVPTDTIGPVVDMVTPLDGTRLSGVVTLTASASDVGSGVDHVDFLTDTGFLVAGSLSSGFWVATVLASDLPNPIAWVKARAWDVAGNTNDSDVVNVSQAESALLIPFVNSDGTFRSDQVRAGVKALFSKSDTFFPEDYGYNVNDTDHTVAMRAFFNALMKNGGHGVLPATEIRVSQPVGIDYSGASWATQGLAGPPYGFPRMRIEGQGSTVFTKAGVGTDPIIIVSGKQGTAAGPSNNNKVRFLEMFGFQINGANLAGHGLYVRSLAHCSFHDVEMIDVGGSGIYMARETLIRAADASDGIARDEYSYANKFENMGITSANGWGVENSGTNAISATFKDVEAIGCTAGGWKLAPTNMELGGGTSAIGCGTGSSTGRGLLVIPPTNTLSVSSGFTADGFRSEGNSAPGGYEVQIEGSSGALLSNLNIIANTGASAIGVGLGATTTQRATIVGGTITGTASTTAGQYSFDFGAQSIRAHIVSMPRIVNNGIAVSSPKDTMNADAGVGTLIHGQPFATWTQ